MSQTAWGRVVIVPTLLLLACRAVVPVPSAEAGSDGKGHGHRGRGDRDAMAAAELSRLCDGGDGDACNRAGLAAIHQPHGTRRWGYDFDEAESKYEDAATIEQLLTAEAAFFKGCSAGEYRACRNQFFIGMTVGGVLYKTGASECGCNSDDAKVNASCQDGCEPLRQLRKRRSVHRGDDADEAVQHTMNRLLAEACKNGDGHACSEQAFWWPGQGEDADAKRATFYRDGCSASPVWPPACAQLGVAFINGEGVPKNADTAKKLMRKACDLGATHGCNLLLRLGEVPGVTDEPRVAAADDEDDVPPLRTSRAEQPRERRRWSTSVSGDGQNPVEASACSEAKAEAMAAAITACGSDGRSTGKNVGSCRCSSSGTRGFVLHRCDVSASVSCE